MSKSEREADRVVPTYIAVIKSVKGSHAITYEITYVISSIFLMLLSIKMKMFMSLQHGFIKAHKLSQSCAHDASPAPSCHPRHPMCMSLALSPSFINFSNFDPLTC